MTFRDCSQGMTDKSAKLRQKTVPELIVCACVVVGPQDVSIFTCNSRIIILRRIGEPGDPSKLGRNSWGLRVWSSVDRSGEFCGLRGFGFEEESLVLDWYVCRVLFWEFLRRVLWFCKDFFWVKCRFLFGFLLIIVDWSFQASCNRCKFWKQFL